MTDLVQTPEGVELFICDLPRFYAVGDEDTVMVFREVVEGGHPEDMQVVEYLGKLGGLPLVHSSTETNPRTGLELHRLHYQREGIEPTRERLAELIAPLATISARRDKAKARTLLT